MPVVSVTLLPVYPPEVEARLVQRLAKTTRCVIAAPDAGTTVYVSHANTYQRDGRVYTDGGTALPNASVLVRSFLEAMQAREFATAQSFLAAGFSMRFPGSAPMHKLEELLDFSRSRYQRVAKSFERFEESWAGDHTVVYCSGTLYGEWPDGSAFEGIRFIDRFELADGLIRRQDVWNDLSLHQPLTSA
jgi:hypothetical protein